MYKEPGDRLVYCYCNKACNNYIFSQALLSVYIITTYYTSILPHFNALTLSPYFITTSACQSHHCVLNHLVSWQQHHKFIQKATLSTLSSNQCSLLTPTNSFSILHSARWQVFQVFGVSLNLKNRHCHISFVMQ